MGDIAWIVALFKNETQYCFHYTHAFPAISLLKLSSIGYWNYEIMNHIMKSVLVWIL